MTDRTTIRSEYEHTGCCAHAPHIVVHYNTNIIDRPCSVTDSRTLTTNAHRYDLAFAEGRLTLLVPEGRTTPSNVPVPRRLCLVDLVGPAPLLRGVLALLCPASFSSSCSLLAISWYSWTVLSTTHARHE